MPENANRAQNFDEPANSVTGACREWFENVALASPVGPRPPKGPDRLRNEGKGFSMVSEHYDDLILKERNYNSYLKVPELLSLQQLISPQKHHDEMFFIIIHQTAELWFKEILHETHILVESFMNGVVSRALKTLKRIQAIMNLQIQQIQLLSTLTPVEFGGFRDLLKPASGFQSIQYREIEFTYGFRDTFFLKFFSAKPELMHRLKAIQEQPSVYDALIRCLDKDGHPIPKEILERDVTQPWEPHEGLVSIVREVYENPKEHYHWVLMLEAMLDLDEKFVLWRKTHAVMVYRAIGNRQGTGGSKGYDFLVSREDLKFFPELWTVRNLIGGDY